MQTTLTAALAAVEAAWASQPGTASATEALWDALYVLETALRAVRSSGGTVCVLSRESVESFRAHKTLLDKACDTAKSGDHEAWEVDSNAADDAACRCVRPLRRSQGDAMTDHWTDALVNLYACSESVTWARGYDSLPAAWSACQRGDWMLWLAGKLAGPPWSDARRPVVCASAQCAGLALPYIKDWWIEGVVRSTIQTCVAWSEGEASNEEMRAAAAAAAAASAAAAAAYTAAATAAAAAAAYTATAAATAAADAAAYAAAAAARTRILAQCADIVRGTLPCPALP